MNACLLDIDGTLIVTGRAGQRAFAEAMRDLFDVEEVNGEVSFAGRSDRAIATDLMRHHGIDPTEENWASFQEGYLKRLPSALEQGVGTVLPGVPELLSSLRARGDILVGLLTGNMMRAAKLKLTHYGLWEHFNFGGFGDRHLDRNDIAADAVAEAARHHASDANDKATIVVIGDTPNDIRCARSVGAKAVAVATGDTRAAALRLAGPDLLVDTLEDAQQVLGLFS